MDSTFAFVIGMTLMVALVVAANEHLKMKALPPDERAKAEKAREDTRLASLYGPVNQMMVCPHCQQRNCVRTQRVDRKKGISGGKATAAVLTGGASLLAVGLSRKEQFTQARCDNCKNIWLF